MSDIAALPRSASSRDESVRFVRQISESVKEFIAPNPTIYWVDFLTTILVGNLALAWCMESPLWSASFWTGYLLAGFAFYRATVFSHEVTHFRAGTMGRFRFAWNLLCGVPFMFPSFIYEDHKSHHVNHMYGTDHDGEYLPLGSGPWSGILLFMSRIFIVPVAGLFRFVVLGPLSWCIPSMRPWVWSRASAASTMNMSHRCPVPDDPIEMRSWRIQEAACFTYAITVFLLMSFGFLPWTLLVYYYFTFLLVAALNYTRTLGAHRYLNEGEPTTYVEQLLDTNTFPGHPLLTELWAPLGMRYHALHHLVPSLPYHNLGKAHRKLMCDLPADSPYRQTVRATLGEAIAELFQHSRRAARDRYRAA